MMLCYCWQAVRAIGRCAVSLEKAAQRCISVLLELIQSKVNYVVQEAVIVIKVGSCSVWCALAVLAARALNMPSPISSRTIS